MILYAYDNQIGECRPLKAYTDEDNFLIVEGNNLGDIREFIKKYPVTEDEELILCGVTLSISTWDFNFVLEDFIIKGFVE